MGYVQTAVSVTATHTHWLRMHTHLSKFHHTLYKEHTLVQTLSVPGACLAAGSPRALMGLDAHSQ